jgi:hypothetical protein
MIWIRQVFYLVEAWADLDSQVEVEKDDHTPLRKSKSSSLKSRSVTPAVSELGSRNSKQSQKGGFSSKISV